MFVAGLEFLSEVFVSGVEVGGADEQEVGGEGSKSMHGANKSVDGGRRGNADIGVANGTAIVAVQGNGAARKDI